MRTTSDLVLVRTRSKTSTAARRELGDAHSFTVTLVQKHQSLQEPNSRTGNAIQNSKRIGSTKSLSNLHFSTRHALPLTFVRFLRPQIVCGDHAKCPRRGRAEVPIHGRNHVLDLGVSEPHPGTRQRLVRSTHTAWSEKRPFPRSVRIHGLSMATNRRETGRVRAQYKGTQRMDTDTELIRASKWSCPTGEIIINAAFTPSSLQSSHKESTAYVLI
jgi:hypothetical protein